MAHLGNTVVNGALRVLGGEYVDTINGVTVGSTPKFTDTTYGANNGVGLSGTTFYNSGVRAVATGGSNGTINVNTNGTATDVPVKGLGAMAYKASVSKSDVGLGNVANLNQSKAIKSITRSGTTFTATAIDGTTSSFTQQDNNTTYANVSTSAAGLAPKVTDTGKYLKGDGTWATPTNTTYSNVSTSAAGLAPKVTSTSAFLKGDGTWATPTNTTYSNVSTSAAGLAPKITDTSKFLKGDGTWATPTNTTYSNVSSASAGLAPKGAAVSSQSQNTKFLREDGSWAKPSYTTNTNTTYTFANGTNGFTVTPSGGTAQTVTVTPSVTKSGVGLGNVANLDQSKAIKSITRSGTTFTATALDGTTSSFTQQDNNTTYANVSTSAAGLAPKVTSTSAFLKGDGTWATPTNTWTAMVGATSAANGSVGYVNAVPPKNGYNTKYLRADGTWQEPETYQADNTTGLNDYDVLFSGKKTGSGNYYSSTYKSSNFKYNPSEGNLTVSKVNGVDVTNLATNLISKTTISCGMSDFTKTIDLSTYAGHMVLISFTSDTSANELTAGCVIAVPQFGAKARIIASDTSESYLSLSISGQTLTVSSRSGFWYGVIAYLYIL